MALIAQWGGLRFEITADTARMFSDLKISAESETEDQTYRGQNYAVLKNGKPVQITMSIYLNASLGINVRDESMLVFQCAQRGWENYLYLAGAKLFPFALRMVKAETEETKINTVGTIVAEKINVTFKQSTSEWIIGQPPPEPEPAPVEEAYSYNYSGGGYSGGGTTTKSLVQNALAKGTQLISAAKSQQSTVKKVAGALSKLVKK